MNVRHLKHPISSLFFAPMTECIDPAFDDDGEIATLVARCRAGQLLGADDARAAASADGRPHIPTAYLAPYPALKRRAA